MRTFFILALPRSRTAWLANFFSTGHMHCFHEGLVPYSSVAEYRERATAGNWDVVGNSGSDNLWQVPALVKTFPRAQLLAIHRPEADIRRSVERLGLSGPETWQAFRRLQKAFWDAVETYSLPVFEFDSLSTREGVQAVWETVVPHTPFPVERFRLLRDLNVQVNPQAELAKIHEHRESIAALTEAFR